MSSRRDLVREGASLVRYVMRSSPRLSDLRHYVRAVETLRRGPALRFPSIMIRFPVLIALVDHGPMLADGRGRELQWRVAAAVAVVEATPRGAERFLLCGERFRPIAACAFIVRGLLGEGVVRLSRACLRPWLRRVVQHL